MITTEQIKEMLSQLTLFVRTLQSICMELENQDRRIKALEENRRQKDAAILDLQQKVATVRLLERKKVQ